MRRYLHIGLVVWFTAAMTMAQCILPSAYAHSDDLATTSDSYAGNGTSDSYATSPATGSGMRSSYTADQNESRALTEYLTQHKLPLVGAQVLTDSNGRRSVVLYGFVGSNFGKSDAVKKTRRYLGDPAMRVDNRIKVRPELLSANRAPVRSAPPAGSAYSENQPDTSGYPGAQSYMDQQNQNPAISQYQQFQGQGSAMTTMIPLIALLGVLGMGLAGGNGGGFSFGANPPTGLSPFGYTPYNPYSSSAAPFGSSPYRPSPYGSAPYGTAPYGSSPYGGPPGSYP